MIVELAISIAIYATASLGYAVLVGRQRIAAPRYRQIATGAILGAGALLATVAQHAAGHPAPVSDAIVAVGLASPFGGIPATLIAAVIAAAPIPWLGAQPVYLAPAQIAISAFIGI